MTITEDSATTNGNVRESASERKKLIFKFLRKSLGSLKDFECKLSE